MSLEQSYWPLSTTNKWSPSSPSLMTASPASYSASYMAFIKVYQSLGSTFWKRMEFLISDWMRAQSSWLLGISLSSTEALLLKFPKTSSEIAMRLRDFPWSFLRWILAQSSVTVYCSFSSGYESEFSAFLPFFQTHSLSQLMAKVAGSVGRFLTMLQTMGSTKTLIWEAMYCLISAFFDYIQIIETYHFLMKIQDGRQHSKIITEYIMSRLGEIQKLEDERMTVINKLLGI